MLEWISTTWGDIISLEYGKALRSHGGGGSVRVYGSNGPIGWTDKGLANGPGVILGRKGAYRGVEYSPSAFHVIDTAYYVVPKVELDVRWLFYAIKYHKLGEIDDGSPIPSTTRAAVYVRDLELPSFQEQREIASILSALDDKIELNRRMNVTLEAMAQAIFRDWFVDFGPVRRKLAGDTDPIAIMGGLTSDPAHAAELAALLSQEPVLSTTGPLSKYARVEWGNTTLTKAAYTSAGFPAYSAAGPDGLIEKAERSGVATVISAIGTVGKTYLTSGRWTAIKNTLTVQSNDDYYRFILHMCLSGGSIPVRGSTQQFISLGDLKSWRVALPCDAIAVEFDRLVGALMARKWHAEAENRTLAETRDYLLPRLMSGAVRVGDITEQDAAA